MKCFVCALCDEAEDEKDGEDFDVLFARAIAHGAKLLSPRSKGGLQTCRAHHRMIDEELQDVASKIRRMRRTEIEHE